MPLESFKKTGHVPAPPKQVWESWVDGDRHAEMTGSPASSEGGVGANFTAWNGFITGRWVKLEPGRRVVMRWRTTAFPEDAADSVVEIDFEEADKGTTLTIRHRDIPEGQGTNYLGGWDTHYFEPMARHFGA